MKIKIRNLSAMLAVSAVILSSTSIARADIFTASETVTNFGTFDQNNAGVTYANPAPVGPYACVPTSIANGLAFLNNSTPGGITGLIQPGYGTVNALAQGMATDNFGNTNGGTWYWPHPGEAGEVSGLATYLAQNAPLVSIIGGQFAAATGETYTAGYNQIQNNAPTPLFLYNALQANNAVEFGIYFGSLSAVQNGSGVFTNGAHYLTLTGITYNSTTQSGFLNILDPSGATNFTTLSFDTTTNGYIFLNGGGGYTEAGDDNPQGYTTGAILTDLIEAVPEPSITILTGTGMLALLAFRKFRRNTA
jgi:hypothetical protein